MRTILGRVHAEVINVQATPTRLDGGESRPPGARLSVLLGNGAAAVYLGGPTVTTATGFQLAAGAQISFDAAHGTLYAVATAPTTLSILEGY